jgi:hypothetical protein
MFTFRFVGDDASIVIFRYPYWVIAAVGRTQAL